ncbi:MAG: RNA polymerase sigma-70 factor (ECF subfamily) [Bradymonadia bacterium]
MNSKPQTTENPSDADSVRETATEWRRRLVREAALLSGDAADAEDLAQRAIERGLRNDVGGMDHPFAWLRRTLRNLFIDDTRRANTRSQLEESVSYVASQRTSKQPGTARLEVGQALQALPAEMAQALLLVVVEGYAYAEVAEIQGVKVGTVKSRVARARRMVADQMEGNQ